MPWRCQWGTSRYSVPVDIGNSSCACQAPEMALQVGSHTRYGMRGNMKLKFHPDIGVNFPINRPARKTIVLLWSRHSVNLNLTSHQVAFAFALQLICLAFKQFFCNKKILSLKF